MGSEEYAEKHARYMKLKVTVAVRLWSKANERARKLQAKLAAASEKEASLWNRVVELERENPDEVALRNEIMAEHSRRLAAGQAAKAAPACQCSKPARSESEK